MTSRESPAGNTSDLPPPALNAGGRRRSAVTLIDAALPVIVLIRAYQLLLRPFLAGSCKYCPTCSEYAIEAVRRYGPMRGGWLAVRRLARCVPFRPGGYDPVPDAAERSRD
ncbi:MAG: hypothetical protein BroJett003_08050 [Planctomycetota bacterium]|nr:MAG: hypothetical protein BroJett003_08050 [Planctomycetota bacterium]